MFAIFSYGMMEPLALRELVSESFITAAAFLLIGVGLAIYLQDKKIKSQMIGLTFQTNFSRLGFNGRPRQ